MAQRLTTPVPSVLVAEAGLLSEMMRFVRLLEVLTLVVYVYVRTCVCVLFVCCVSAAHGGPIRRWTGGWSIGWGIDLQ